MVFSYHWNKDSLGKGGSEEASRGSEITHMLASQWGWSYEQMKGKIGEESCRVHSLVIRLALRLIP